MSQRRIASGALTAAPLIAVVLGGLCGFPLQRAFAQGLADLVDQESSQVVTPHADVQAPKAKRHPPPSAEAQREAARRVRDVFMPDARGAVTTEAKKSLASQLLRVVDEERDVATRFYLLQAAANLAAEAGGRDVAIRALTRMATEFEVDQQQLTLDAYERMAEQAPPESLGPVIDCVMGAAREALDHDRFDKAEALAKQAIVGSRRAKDRDRQGTAVQILTDIRAERKSLERLQPFLDRLEEDPTDQAAAWEVGSQWCFRDGRWQQGLPYLARSSDPGIAAAAKAELQAGNNASAQVVAAQQWQKVMTEMAKGERTAVGQHAVELFMAALPALSGLAKVKVDKSIEEIQATLPKSALEAGWRVIFRADDARLWNTNTQEGPSRFALPLAEAPNTVAFLRMKHSSGSYVIIPMTKTLLGQNVRGTNYVWTGTKQIIYGATLLGIGDRAANIMGQQGVPVAVRTGEWLTGYGFGPLGSNSVPTPAWENKPAPGTTIEIAVGSRQLLPEERRFLLDMGEADAGQ